MISLNADELRSAAVDMFEKWIVLQGKLTRDERFDPDTGPSMDVNAHYAVDSSMFLLRVELAAYSEEMTYEACLLTGYEYGESIEVSHEEALSFMETHLGPLAFAVVNDALADLGRKFGALHPRLSPQVQSSFWKDQRELPPEELRIKASSQ